VKLFLKVQINFDCIFHAKSPLKHGIEYGTSWVVAARCTANDVVRFMTVSPVVKRDPQDRILHSEWRYRSPCNHAGVRSFVGSISEFHFRVGTVFFRTCDSNFLLLNKAGEFRSIYL
jgi:hypothetical protein